MTWDAVVQRIKSRLHSRRWAYRALFMTREGEPGQAAEVVMRDLARYCYANKPTLKVSPTTQQTDPYAMAFAEGRRDVWNRIVALCQLSDEQIERIAHSRSNDD